MTEALQTISEHSRSLEDAEKYRALETLREVGLLVPVGELETFASEDNAGEGDTRPMLHAASPHDRAGADKIVTGDTDATVLDLSFDESKLDDTARGAYKQALHTLAISITHGSPVSFGDRAKIAPFEKAAATAEIISQNEVHKLATDAGIDEFSTLQMASAHNAKQLAQTDPVFLASQLMQHPKDVIAASLEVDGQQQEVPINLEYVQRYLREAHIVGAKQPDEAGASVTFFDLEKMNTAPGLEAERQETWQKLGSVATALGEAMRPEVQQGQSLMRLLEDVHAKPEKLIASAMQVEGYEDIFNGAAGSWEGYTLAEHTETVLRNFDETYAEKLPAELIPAMRLTILAHDIGKSVALEAGEKFKQKEYNARQAADFFGKLGVDERLQGVIQAVIGEGAELAFQIDVKKAGEPAERAMQELAAKTLSQFYGSEQVTEEQVAGFTEMCKMLQVCDGGAYTTMAVTNRGNDRWSRNAPWFNHSFVEPASFGKRTIQQKQAGQQMARTDITPLANEKQAANTDAEDEDIF